MEQFVVVGLVLGSIYALAASGLVITYVSTGVLNFAFGALAYFIARTYYYLHIEKDWGILAAAAMCLLVLAPAIGLFLYMAIFRYLRLSSQLIKVVVTIGVSVVGPRPRHHDLRHRARSSRPRASHRSRSHVYTVLGVAVTLDQVIAYACVLAIVGHRRADPALHRSRAERAGDGRLRGDDVAVGEQPVAHRRRRLDGVDVPGRPRGHPRRPGHRPRLREVHPAHRGRVRRGHRGAAAQPARSR